MECARYLTTHEAVEYALADRIVDRHELRATRLGHSGSADAG